MKNDSAWELKVLGTLGLILMFFWGLVLAKDPLPVSAAFGWLLIFGAPYLGFRWVMRSFRSASTPAVTSLEESNKESEIDG